MVILALNLCSQELSCSSPQGGQGSLSKEEKLHCRLSQGWPHLLTDMRIVNADGKELPRDGKSTGELQVRGPHVVQSYFKVCILYVLSRQKGQKLMAQVCSETERKSRAMSPRAYHAKPYFKVVSCQTGTCCNADSDKLLRNVKKQRE